MGTKISELNVHTPLDGTEYLEAIIAPYTPGTNRRITSQQIADLGGGGGGTVTSVSGTTDRITSTGGATPVINIAAAYDAAVTAEIAAALATVPKVLVIACSDEVTPITATAGKVTFRMPYAMTLSAVRASLTTAQTSGSTFTVDINEGGTTILSTKITIDNTATTSVGAATPAVISDAALADNAIITIDVDQIGDTTAKGLKVTLIGS